MESHRSGMDRTSRWLGLEHKRTQEDSPVVVVVVSLGSWANGRAVDRDAEGEGECG